jgi:hydrogenase maturation protease
VGALVRERHRVQGVIEVSAGPVAPGVFRVTVKIQNQTPIEGDPALSRDQALMNGLVSTHIVLAVRDGEFVSLIDPPEAVREAASACRNVGCWPVLVGSEGDKDTILSAPIILYDYPQIAPESPGELFDGTEIDEILTLRIMTLTDDEKAAMAAVDARARAVLARTESLQQEKLLGLHGTFRGLVPRLGDRSHG